MAFFNKKEDVLDIELTQFGKYRLSQGDLNPVYYAFFDDDIIYDAEYGGVTWESGSKQNSIEPRIKEVPRNRTQHVYTGIETQVARNNRLIRTGEIVSDGQTVFVGKKDPGLKIFEPVSDINFSSYAPLGTSALTSDKFPAWSITLYSGELDGTAIQLTSSATALGMKIPQLEATLEYKTLISSPDIDSALLGSSAGAGCGDGIQTTAANMNVNSDLNDLMEELFQQDYQHVGDTSEVYDEFEDDSYISVRGESLLLKVEEINAPYTNDNFDIEVFELTSSTDIAGNVYGSWAPLYFKTRDEFGTYTDQVSDDWTWQQVADLNSSMVHYFLELNTDRQIPEEILCPVLAFAEEKETDLYDAQIICPDLDVIRRSQRLGTTALQESYEGTVKEEDVEGCD